MFVSSTSNRWKSAWFLIIQQTILCNVLYLCKTYTYIEAIILICTFIQLMNGIDKKKFGLKMFVMSTFLYSHLWLLFNNFLPWFRLFWAWSELNRSHEYFHAKWLTCERNSIEISFVEKYSCQRLKNEAPV